MESDEFDYGLVFDGTSCGTTGVSNFSDISTFLKQLFDVFYKSIVLTTNVLKYLFQIVPQNAMIKE